VRGAESRPRGAVQPGFNRDLGPARGENFRIRWASIRCIRVTAKEGTEKTGKNDDEKGGKTWLSESVCNIVLGVRMGKTGYLLYH